MILVGIIRSRITFTVIRVIKIMMMMFTALVNLIMMRETMIYVKIMIVILTAIILMTLIVAL